MTKNEALHHIEAYKRCKDWKNSVSWENSCNAKYKDCDECPIMYEIGTYGEFMESISIAIKALEERIKEQNEEN